MPGRDALTILKFGVEKLEEIPKLKSIGTSAQYDAYRRAFEAVGIKSRKKTHAPRGVAARKLADAGVEYDVIRQMGRWSGDVMMNHYLTGLPWGAIRSIAGFPTIAGSFFLPRAALEPPPELLLKVFPQVEDWEEELRDANICMATTGHLKLLRYLRKVLIQDAAVLQLSHPDFYAWKHEIFSSPIFQKYQESLFSTLDSRPEEAPLPNATRAYPEMVNAMKANHQDIVSQMTVLKDMTKAVATRLDDMADGTVTVTVDMNGRRKSSATITNQLQNVVVFNMSFLPLNFTYE